MSLTQRDFEKQFGDLLQRIQTQSTPFPNDSTEKKIARKKRAKVDRLFAAATYFPHYITLKEEYRTCWKDPDGKYNWVDAGFAPFHGKLFEIAGLVKLFSLVAGYRECGKSTILGKIDPILKIAFEERWFIPILAATEDKAESKVVSLKIEFENNRRLISDFGELQGSVEWEFGSFITKTGRKVKSYGRDQVLTGEENSGHRPDHEIYDDVSANNKPDSPMVVQKVVDVIKGDDLKAVNFPHWSAIYLCNWTMKGTVTDELMTGKNTGHFNKVIFRALVPNPKKTPQEKAIAKACRDHGFSDDMMSAWEYRFPTLELLQEQKDDPDTFDTERMMRPRSRKDKVFRDEWFRYHRLADLDLSKYVVVSAEDPSATETGDMKATVTVGIGIINDGHNDRLHIPVLKADVAQEDIDWMLDRSYDHVVRFHPIKLGVADNAYKDFIKREYLRYMVKRHRPMPFYPVNQIGNKHARIARLAPYVKSGIITFDADDPDQDLIVRQLKAEPNPGSVSAGGIGDDGSDALELAVQLAEEFQSGGGKFEYESVSKMETKFGKGTW
jgi:hypothetical protein